MSQDASQLKTLVWTEFCEACAKFAAYDFAQSWHNYLTENPSTMNVVSEQIVAEKFVDAFVNYFENEAKRICRSSRLLNDAVAVNVSACQPNDRCSPRPVVSSNTNSGSSESSSTSSACIVDHRDRKKSLLSRLSCSRVRQTLFGSRAASSDMSSALTSHDHGLRRPFSGFLHRSRSKTNFSTTKTVVEIIREGTVNYVCGRDLDGKNWEKGRMALVKTIGGYLLEFYSPPKASKPKNGIFCFFISEARETTVLETPYHQNTFVLKGENMREYVIEAKDHADMKEWLSFIRACTEKSLSPEDEHESAELMLRFNKQKRIMSMFEGIRSQRYHSLPLRGSQNTRKSSPFRLSMFFWHHDSPGSSETTAGASGLSFWQPSNSDAVLRRSYSTNHTSRLNVSNRSLNMVRSALSNSLRWIHFAGGSRPSTRNAFAIESRINEFLQEYAWYHGCLSRADAAKLVLQAGAEGHGLFLVRQSETRRGEYVLTFNCNGRAKHLRITILSNGRCRIQHLWFDSILDMLDYFRSHYIALENVATGGIVLGDYVIAWPPQREDRFHSGGETIDPRNYMTHGGSVRITTRSLERLAAEREQSPLNLNLRTENSYQFM